MAIVGEIVAKFRAETADYEAKTAALKAKNRAVADDLIKTAGSAQKALDTLAVAKRSGSDLSAYGIDKRNISGISSQIKELTKNTSQFGGGLMDAATKARGLEHVFHGIEGLASGNWLHGISQIARGAEHAGLGINISDNFIKGALVVGAVNAIGGALAEATKKIVEMENALREGKANWHDMFNTVAEGVPVFGGFYQTVENVAEAFTGQRAAIEKENQTLREHIALRNMLLDLDHEQRKIATNNAYQSADITEDAKVAALHDMGNDHAANLRSIGDQRDRAVRDFGRSELERLDKVAKQLTAPTEKDGLTLDQQLNAAKKKVDDADKSVGDKLASPGSSASDVADAIIAKHDAQKDLKDVQDRWNQAAAKYDDLKRKSDADIAARTKAENLKADEARIAENKRAFAVGVKGAADDVANYLGSLKIKGTPILDWAKEQLDKANKLAEEMLAKSKKYADDARTPAQRVSEDFSDHLAAMKANPGVYTKDMLSKYTSDEYNGLLDQKKSLEEQGQGRIYNLPDVSDLRGGATLYAAPERKLSEDQLKKLGEIKEELTAIKTSADKAGITIQVIK